MMKDKVETTVVDLVATGRSSRVVLQELAEKNDIVFATSHEYMISTEGVARDNPQVKFENVSGTRLADNLAAFSTRAYQPRYLSGLIAGGMTKTGKVGYVAAHPVPEVIRGINAFTLGVRQANPTAEVQVQWTNSWHKPVKEREVAAALVKGGVDILAHHSDSSAVAEFAEENGVKVIGFNSDMSAFAPTQHLASVTHNWGLYYVKRIQALIDNKWKGKSEWIGMEEKISQLSSLSVAIPIDVRNLVAKQKAAIIAGKLNIFTGPIKNTRGRMRVKKDKVLADAKLLRMDWYVEGVAGSLPSF
jgi:basic membrane lipoprotein Med (substrate-binding protein (PBP1-ABC) superfamily)